MNHLSVSPKKSTKAAVEDVFLVFIIAATAAAVFMLCLTIINSTSLYIQDLYVPSLVVPALNKTTTFNTSAFIDLKFERAAALTPHSYGDFQMTLLYGQYRSKSTFQIGTHMVQGFSMGRKRRVHVKVAVEAVGMPWQEASRAVSGGNVVAMVVKLMMSPKWQAIPLVARVAVDASGHMVSKKPIEFEWWY